MNSDFVLDIDAEQIAWLHIDKQDSATNVLSESLLEAFDETLINLAQMHPKGLVIISDKPSGFIAGADVKDFANVTNAGAAEKHIARTHEIFNRLESLAIPTVAIIHGYCLGGGLELALACDYRVATDDDRTKMGFPEVKLGIFPGYGGTVRATKKLGHLAALNIMLSGRTLSGKAAKKIHLVDNLVPYRQRKNAARALLKQIPKVHAESFLNKVIGLHPVRMVVAHYLKKQVSKRVDKAHYPAPFQLIEHWLTTANNPNAMYQSEITRVARLLNTDTAQNLIRVFLLQNRLKALGDKKDFEVNHVHVVGGGVMGGDIAAWCALQGLQVSLQDREPKYLSRAIGRANQLFKQKLKNPYLRQAASDRLMPDHQGNAVAKADVVIEAIFEDIEAKQALYAQLQPKMKKGALLATNTSSIPLETLAEKLDDPDSFVGLHFFNPVAKMPLLEVVKTVQTNALSLIKATAFARHINKLPLIVNSSPGFLVNRVLMPYLLEAVALLSEGVDAPLIDKAAVSFGMPMGPIELSDTVGLDICLSVASKMSTALGNAVPPLLQQAVDAGHVGKKSGHGFYRWNAGKPEKGTIKTSTISEQDITDRLLMRLVNESVACLREGVVEDEDLLDAGIIFGAGFAPFRGGPMRHIAHEGGMAMQNRLKQLETNYGEHFHADDGWAAIV